MTITEITASAETYHRVHGYASTWAAARATSSGLNAVLNCGVNKANPTTYYILRSGLRFDTSIIPDGDPVTDVRLKLTAIGDYSTTDFDVQICEQDWSSQSPLSDANREAFYDNCLAEADYFVWRNTAGMSVDTPYTGPAMNVAWVNKTGYTYYSLRGSADYANSDPGDRSDVDFRLPGDGTAAYRPTLIITHGAVGNAFIMF